MLSVQNPNLEVDALVGGGKPVRVPLSRKEKIQAELKLLEWHKMANNAAIKGALLQTKASKTTSNRKQATYAKDDARWIKRVIKEEHIKPLEVSKDFVMDYERRERENADRLTNQVDRHISTLKTLRSKLEARHDLKTRTDEYRQWQRDFLPKKHAVMIGKTLDEIEPATGNRNNNNEDNEDNPDNEIDDAAMLNERRRGNSKSGHSSQELSTVLDSLSRLADLEQRISGLEKENQYDKLVAIEQPQASQRSSVEFRKKRTAQPAQDAPVAMVYQVRTRRPDQRQQQQTQQQSTNRNWRVQVPPAGAAARAVRAKQQGHSGSGWGPGSTRRGHGTFITEGGDDDGGGGGDTAANTRDAARMERLRQRELAPAGQKNLRTRVQARKGRAREQMLGAKKHEEAMKEMARRKHETVKRGTVGGAARNTRMQQQQSGRGGVTAPRKGASSGLRNKNRHLQDFENLKAGHKKRRDDIQRRAHQQPDPVNTVRSSRNKGGAIGGRFVSQTAPAYHSARPNGGRGGGRGAAATASRMPATKMGGTTTRRTDAPIRRKAGAGAGGDASSVSTDPLNKIPGSAPAIAVTGMGGLRVIKATGTQRTTKQQPYQRGGGRR